MKTHLQVKWIRYFFSFWEKCEFFIGLREMFITMSFQPTNESPEINEMLQHRCTELYSPNKWFSEFLHHSVQFSSVAQACLTLCDPMNRSTPVLPVHHQLPESTQTHVHWVSDAIQPSHPLLCPSPPASIFPSIRAFSNESALRIRWPKYWSFSFNISPSNEHPGLISFRMDYLDLLAVQEN